MVDIKRGGGEESWSGLWQLLWRVKLLWRGKLLQLPVLKLLQPAVELLQLDSNSGDKM